MNKIIYNLVFNKRKKLNARGLGLIQVEAYLHKKKRYFSTNIYVLPEQWDNEGKFINKNHPNSEALNRMIGEYLYSIEKIELSLWKQGISITLELLKKSLLKAGNTDSFISFCLVELSQLTAKENTKKNHKTTLNLLAEYKRDLRFSDLTYEFLCDFELFLQSKKYHINTIAKHLKHLKKYVNIAINKEYINFDQYAFRKYKIKSVDNNHTYLSPEELGMLEQLNLDDKNIKLRKTLDAFLFCCYTGLRYSDFTNLNSSNFELINNDSWLIYKSVKTHIEVRVPLYLLFSGKSISIMSKYSDSIDDFFNLGNNSNINKDLIRISKLLNLKKHISFHTARHTNATLLIYNGINITTVQKILGHKSIKTTQIYTNIMDMTIVKDLKEIFLP